MCGGDFIEDRNGKKISLTALMFGRHHKAFDFADYIQINQFKPGKATLYITMKSYLGRVGQTCSPKMDTRFDSGSPASLFDLSNVAIDFDFKIISKPIRMLGGLVEEVYSRTNNSAHQSQFVFECRCVSPVACQLGMEGVLK